MCKQKALLKVVTLVTGKLHVCVEYLITCYRHCWYWCPL